MFIYFINSSWNTRFRYLTIKPATPKSIVSFYDVRCNGDYIARKIKEYSSKGYIYKHGFGSDCHIVVVMEKY